MSKKSFQLFKVKDLDSIPDIGANSWGAIKSGKGFGIALRNKLEQYGVECEPVNRAVDMIERGKVIELVGTNEVKEISKLTGLSTSTIYYYKTQGEAPKNALQFYFDNQKECIN